MNLTLRHTLALYILLFCCLVGASCSRKASLHIEAQIIYNMGGAQPVARQTFYLLDTDPITLKFEKREGKSEGDNSNKVSDEYTLYVLSAANFGMFTQQIKDAGEKGRTLEKFMIPMVGNAQLFLKPHIVKSTQTDFQGRAIFDDLKPGDYWLMGITETRSSFAFWNHKVTVESGENKVLLDQNNALYSK